MNMNEIYETILNIIEDVTDIPKDEIEEDSSLISDLDISSIEIMAVVSEVWKEFSIKIKEEQLLTIETVKELVELVSEGAGID